MGYDLEKIGRRVSNIYGIEKNEIYSKGRRKVQVNARDLLCYWVLPGHPQIIRFSHRLMETYILRGGIREWVQTLIID